MLPPYTAVRVVDTERVTVTSRGPMQVLRADGGAILYVAASTVALWQMIARARAAAPTLVHGRHHDLVIWVNAAAATALIGMDPPYAIAGRLPDGLHTNRADVVVDGDGRWYVGDAVLTPVQTLPRARRITQGQ